MRKRVVLVVLVCLCGRLLPAQQPGKLFQPDPSSRARSLQPLVPGQQIFLLNLPVLHSLRQHRSADLRLSLPFEGDSMVLDLHRVNITSENFNVVEARSDGSRVSVDYSDGIFYQGKLTGSDSTFATLSIFDDQVMGVISDRRGNIVLGRIGEDARSAGYASPDQYILYRETNLGVANPASCTTPEFTERFVAATTDAIMTDATMGEGTTAEATKRFINPGARNNHQRVGQTGAPIEIYFECDYTLYQNRGRSTSNVIDFVLAFFNGVALLYENEDIKIQCSQILVWTTPDPEMVAGLTTTLAMLPSFSQRIAGTEFNGDFAHFLSTRNNDGGRAWLLESPCLVGQASRTAISDIYNDYMGLPVFSWTVDVVAHEMGHNLGSNHTQWCGWIGGALDNCFPTEATNTSCPPGPQPLNGGTIMSYCHTISTGVNFANGFGQQPGDRIRSVVAAATCFSDCRISLETQITPASCGLDDGTAQVTVLNSRGSLGYAWSNGQTSATLSNVLSGVYSVIVTDSQSGCTLVKDVIIGSQNTTLPILLTPSGEAGFCNGGTVELNVTSHPGYRYTWAFNGDTIQGATTSAYTAFLQGEYSVTATASTCTSTQSVTLVKVVPPVALISTQQPTSFCSGGQVRLNADAGAAYRYQWSRNAVPIPGAQSSSFIATESGDYSVRVFAGGAGCESISPAVAVNVQPSPVATISSTIPSGRLCAGDSLTIFLVPGPDYMYRWYRNGVLLPGLTQPSLRVSATGSYTAVTELAHCTDTSETANLIFNPLPVITVNPATSSILKFETQLITASGAAEYDFFQQPAVVSIHDSTMLVRPLTTTSYLITGRSTEGCTGTAQSFVKVRGCGDVTDITSYSLSASRTLISWKNPPESMGDTLQYRPVGRTEWARIYVDESPAELRDLLPGTNYEYEVIPLCNTTSEYLPTTVSNFTTAALADGVFIGLFPNPARTTCRIEIVTESAFVMKGGVFDNLGRMVMPLQASAAGSMTRTLDVSRLAAGIYSIHLNINGVIRNLRLMVQP